MKDENGAVLYVGKSVNLHQRVRSYFQTSGEQNPKTAALAKKIFSFEYIVTENEVEALVLECNMIKRYHPPYNAKLKDDKAYPYLKISVHESLPRVLYAHHREKDKCKYYGPYVSAMRAHEVLELIHKIWPLRRCVRKFPRDFNKDRPCLNYHIGQCKAPCHKFISEGEYNVYVAEAEQFIQGKTDKVVKKIRDEMGECSENMQFERAAELRDLLNALQILSERQRTDTCDGDDRDVIAIARNEAEALMQVFFVRDGRLIGREHFLMQAESDLTEAEVFSAFIKQFYGEAAFIPKELALSHEAAENELISSWLSQVKGQKVAIIVPQKGDKFELVQLALKNAALTIEQFGGNIRRETERNANALAELAHALKINEPLLRIEAYDISNIQGFESVGSMIVFENGRAKNSDYRKFKIKSVMGPDDYASMEEIITRRFNRYMSEQNDQNGRFSKLPDLILIDGGKGQINAAEKILRAMEFSIPVCGMVKDEKHRTRGIIYNNEEILPPKNGECFKLICRIQDEVHRFALEYHRKLRAGAKVHSVLDDIPGIGPLRRKALMKHFKAIEPIREASVD
ncbi:MAG: excinuclease ABC subunit UvrC, partial [Defluviitaleaceae bacterium]|nr:excinuclease ABC subunit UvrC [Defluviitaleaceae bacterium]